MLESGGSSWFSYPGGQPSSPLDGVVTEIVDTVGRKAFVNSRDYATLHGHEEVIADNPFKPFATSTSQGMGLGLSIRQTIAGTHGGTHRFVSSTKKVEDFVSLLDTFDFWLNVVTP
ncbi:hypothetical protein JF540_11960 [Salipiger thiooxidans]|uniref:hypothetical protein n=1 Tax=Salipiger thiooxidans TaxID=282683 RepID=UPI001A8EC8F2|nr:hypothetical protein [Salipiger thiooxidans]MBN8187408.1 hypothetical protein [Salipiger thiooxidans]